MSESSRKLVVESASEANWVTGLGKGDYGKGQDYGKGGGNAAPRTAKKCGLVCGAEELPWLHEVTSRKSVHEL